MPPRLVAFVATNTLNASRSASPAALHRALAARCASSAATAFRYSGSIASETAALFFKSIPPLMGDESCCHGNFLGQCPLGDGDRCRLISLGRDLLGGRRW